MLAPVLPQADAAEDQQPDQSQYGWIPGVGSQEEREVDQDEEGNGNGPGHPVGRHDEPVRHEVRAGPVAAVSKQGQDVDEYDDRAGAGGEQNEGVLEAGQQMQHRRQEDQHPGQNDGPGGHLAAA